MGGHCGVASCVGPGLRPRERNRAEPTSYGRALLWRGRPAQGRGDAVFPTHSLQGQPRRLIRVWPDPLLPRTTLSVSLYPLANYLLVDNALCPEKLLLALASFSCKSRRLPPKPVLGRGWACRQSPAGLQGNQETENPGRKQCKNRGTVWWGSGQASQGRD